MLAHSSSSAFESLLVLFKSESCSPRQSPLASPNLGGSPTASAPAQPCSLVATFGISGCCSVHIAGIVKSTWKTVWLQSLLKLCPQNLECSPTDWLWQIVLKFLNSFCERVKNSSIVSWVLNWLLFTLLFPVVFFLFAASLWEHYCALNMACTWIRSALHAYTFTVTIII